MEEDGDELHDDIEPDPDCSMCRGSGVAYVSYDVYGHCMECFGSFFPRCPAGCVIDQEAAAKKTYDQKRQKKMPRCPGIITFTPQTPGAVGLDSECVPDDARPRGAHWLLLGNGDFLFFNPVDGVLPASFVFSGGVTPFVATTDMVLTAVSFGFKYSREGLNLDQAQALVFAVYKSDDGLLFNLVPGDLIAKVMPVPQDANTTVTGSTPDPVQQPSAFPATTRFLVMAALLGNCATVFLTASVVLNMRTS